MPRPMPLHANGQQRQELGWGALFRQQRERRVRTKGAGLGAQLLLGPAQPWLKVPSPQPGPGRGARSRSRSSMPRVARAAFTGPGEGEWGDNASLGVGRSSSGKGRGKARQRGLSGQWAGRQGLSLSITPCPLQEQPRCFRCPCSHCPPPPRSRSPEKTLGWRSPPPPGQAGRGSPSSRWLLTGPKESQTVPEEEMVGVSY